MNKNCKVALLTMDFPPSVGGVQEYLFEVSKRIAHHYRLSVVTPVVAEQPGAGNTTQTQTFQCIHVPTSMPWHFARVLARLRPHITLVGHAHPRLLLPAALLSWGRYIALTHGGDFEAAQARWHAPFFNRLLAGARPLLTNSQALAQCLAAHGLPTPMVIYPGTNPEQFTPSTTPHEGPPVLLTVARLVSLKGIDIVLRALPHLLARVPGLQYWVAGSGPQRSALAQLAQDLRVSHAVRFLGSVSHDELPSIYRRATVFVMPTCKEPTTGREEGFGIVYLEASASGLPVVAARSGGAVEAVRDGETGITVPADDPTAVAQAVERLLDDSELRQQMGRAGRHWVESEMNWDQTAQQILSVMCEVR